MTNFEVYQTCLTLVKHVRDDVIFDSSEGAEKDIAIETCDAMVNTVIVARKYIEGFPIEEETATYDIGISSNKTFKSANVTKYREEVSGTVRSPDSCEELYQYIYDALKLTQAKLVDNIPESDELMRERRINRREGRSVRIQDTDAYTNYRRYVGTICRYFVDVIENNHNLILRSCLSTNDEDVEKMELEVV